MPYRRTIRKPTRWTPEEWRQIEDAAAAHGVPPLRYVREAALAGKLPPRAQTRAHVRQGRHALVRQLTRVLSNLNQLARVADAEGAGGAILALESTIATTESAVPVAAAHPAPAVELAALTNALRDAGRYLNEIARHANGIKELPPYAELGEALSRILTAVHAVLR
jgi:hypothetical protein